MILQLNTRNEINTRTTGIARTPFPPSPILLLRRKVEVTSQTLKFPTWSLTLSSTLQPSPNGRRFLLEQVNPRMHKCYLNNPQVILGRSAAQILHLIPSCGGVLERHLGPSSYVVYHISLSNYRSFRFQN
jgi:hypothetical protein